LTATDVALDPPDEKGAISMKTKTNVRSGRNWGIGHSIKEI